MNLLFTCVGRRVELIKAFRVAAQQLKIPLILYGADNSLDAPALFFCDRQKHICRIHQSEYIPELIHFCAKEGIDALIPTIDTDLMKLAEAKDQFAKIGTSVIVSDLSKIVICRDKRKTALFFRKLQLNTPATVDNINNYNDDFPCLIKPIDGSSSIGVFTAESRQELEWYANHLKSYIIQPFIDGTEYTVDIFCDLSGQAISITPRRRLATRSGEVLKTQIDLDQEIIHECHSLIDTFKPCGAITVQLIKERQTNKNFYIEINPRFGGGAPLSIRAGANSAKMLLQLLSKDMINRSKAEDGAIYSRFDDSVRISRVIKIKELKEVLNITTNIKAMIFDLDDTLYSEKNYVKSGFYAVSEFLGDACIYEKLCEAFENGERAFDKVFDDEQTKEQCLKIYRFHKPDIRLYDGVTEVLKILKDDGFLIGIITDGRPEGQRAKINALGLRNWVDEIIITDELGGERFRKPNDLSFRIMQHRLNIPFEQMIYVGDNVKKDFAASMQLGIKSVWFENEQGLYYK